MSHPRFIQRIERAALPAEMVLAKFDPTQYRLSLFKKTGIAFPGALATACPSRQAEYLAGRMAAVSALTTVGARILEIAREDCGRPIWPQGFAGSISHSQNGCVALVHCGSNALVGVDLEHLSGLAAYEAISEMVLSISERHRLESMDREMARLSALLVFSAKETLFKAISSILRKEVDMSDLEFVGFDGSHQLCIAPVRPPLTALFGHRTFKVQFRTLNEFVLTWYVEGGVTQPPPPRCRQFDANASYLHPT